MDSAVQYLQAVRRARAWSVDGEREQETLSAVLRSAGETCGRERQYSDMVVAMRMSS